MYNVGDAVTVVRCGGVSNVPATVVQVYAAESLVKVRLADGWKMTCRVGVDII